VSEYDPNYYNNLNSATSNAESPNNYSNAVNSNQNSQR